MRWAALGQLVHAINRINQTGRRVFRDDPPAACFSTPSGPRRSGTTATDDISEEEIEEEEAIA